MLFAAEAVTGFSELCSWLLHKESDDGLYTDLLHQLRVLAITVT